jgi:hypothetical protein
VLCSVPAAWKADPTYHERMVHVPFCLAVLMGSAFAVYKTKRFRTRLLQAMALAMGGFLLVVNARAIRAIPPGDSWMARFRRMSENHPEIQAFVFAQPEFGSGGYGDFDKLVSLRLALPNHVVLSPGEGMARWDVSPRRVTTPEQYKSAPLPNAWLSPEAKALLGL